MRALVVAAVAVVSLAGCAPDLTAAELATAKCAHAVHDELGLTEAETVRTSDVTVEGDDDERRLTGRWEVADAGYGEFDCVVVPDESDELRGLRVTELDVRQARDPA
jgi:hypothetical protein